MAKFVLLDVEIKVVMKFFIAIFLCTILLFGCKTNEDIIPNVSFSGQIYIPTISGNPTIVKYDLNQKRLGVNGVVIYRVAPDEYYAFDLMCPNEKSFDCFVKILDGATCQCPCCKTMYLIVTDPGSVVEGPSKWPLKSYQTYISGDYLTIYN